jgi:Rrf2 family protein
MSAVVKITARCLYAWRALIELARQEPGAPLTAPAIARRLGLSRLFLAQVLKDLKRAGLVRSIQGKKGGFLLQRPPRAIRLGQIVDAVGSISDDLPASATEPTPADRLLQQEWREAARAFEHRLNRLTLQDALDQLPPEA